MINPRIIFMGSPDFAVRVLEALAARYSVVGVVTQPDRPAGRGRRISPPPVKVLAESLDLPLIQPLRLRQPEVVEHLRHWLPDLIVVAAFGQILRPEVLELPAFGCLNVHASLLPRWRGAAPIPAAILHGDLETGVSIMRMDAGVDTGPILSQKATPVLSSDTAGSLARQLSVLGANLLLETLPGYLDGSIPPVPQEETQATYAPMLKKTDGDLDFNLAAVELARRIRAFNPWPGAFTTWKGGVLKILRAAPISQSQDDSALVPGTRVIVHGHPAVSTSQGLLVLEEVQPAGKKSMPGKVYLRGARDWA